MRYKGSQATFKCKTDCVIFSIDKESFVNFFKQVPEAKQWFDIMLDKYNVDLESVLRNQTAAKYLTLFLESEYSEENIHYIYAVEDFRQAWQAETFEEAKTMAGIIINLFIKIGSHWEINIAGLCVCVFFCLFLFFFLKEDIHPNTKKTNE